MRRISFDIYILCFGRACYLTPRGAGLHCILIGARGRQRTRGGRQNRTHTHTLSWMDRTSPPQQRMGIFDILQVCQWKKSSSWTPRDWKGSHSGGARQQLDTWTPHEAAVWTQNCLVLMSWSEDLRLTSVQIASARPSRELQTHTPSWWSLS